MAGSNVLVDTCPERVSDAPMHRNRAVTFARALRELCRSQPELSGLVIGLALSAPLVAYLGTF